MLSIQAGAKVAAEAPKQRDRRLLVGTWLYAQNCSVKIYEEDGNLMAYGLVLDEDGDYMIQTFFHGGDVHENHHFIGGKLIAHGQILISKYYLLMINFVFN